MKIRCQPDVLVLHLGKNDLVTCLSVQLLDDLTQDIMLIKQLMPRASLISADMLLRQMWLGQIAMT